jgi:hypothetical protein
MESLEKQGWAARLFPSITLTYLDFFAYYA